MSKRSRDARLPVSPGQRTLKDLFSAWCMQGKVIGGTGDAASRGFLSGGRYPAGDGYV
jgi:hypothetical protein